VNNFSIHKIFFEIIPGFNSIRSPSRYIIIVGFFVIFGIYYYFDNIYSKSNKICVKITIFGIFLLLLLDQYRTPFIGWDKSGLINTDLMSKKEEILTKCDYFFYDKPGGWWYDQIEAMTFSIQIGIPTVNGYSGAFPPGYPNEKFDSMAQPNKIFDWIGEIDKTKKGCFVSGSSPLKFLNRDEFSIDFVGFKSENIQQEFESQFSISPNPYLYIVDYSGDDLKLSFDLFPSNCTEKQDIRINLNGQLDLFQGEISKSGQNFLFELNFENEIVKKLDIITNFAGCRVNENPENEFFYIQNFKYS